jgi:hypothetical protein
MSDASRVVLAAVLPLPSVAAVHARVPVDGPLAI